MLARAPPRPSSATPAELAATITAEQGKHVAEAEAEAARIAGIVRLCAEEAGRLEGRVLPLDAAPAGVGRLGYTRPEPTGVVLAITPFNYPAILVIHKIGPALAAGNAVILKPAGATPLTARFLVERLCAPGSPRARCSCVAGPGATLGAALCADPRVRKISFTGSEPAGHAIARAAGAKRLTCELGSNAAMVVLDDADVALAAAAIAFSGYTNAGQNCVSTQRVLVHAARCATSWSSGCSRTSTPCARAIPPTRARRSAPLIDAREAERVVQWIGEAGGEAVRGGDRDGTLVAPSVVLEPERRRPHLAGRAVRPRRRDPGDRRRRARAPPTTPASGWP